MRVIFMGTPDFAVGTLEEIIKAGHEVVLVVSQPDKAVGRSKALKYTPVKECAVAHGIEVYQPAKIRAEESVEYLRQYNADIIIVEAFGQIIPKAILDMPRFGCVNVHASLLPKYRGAAPIQWAVLNGDQVTGVTTMRMDEGLDTGDMIMKQEVIVDEDETGGSLFDKLSEVGAKLCVKTMEAIENGTAVYTPQDDALATHTGKIQKEMGSIDWSKDAEVIERLVRGLNPWPSAYTRIDDKNLKIWRAKVISHEVKAAPGCILKVTKDELEVQTGNGVLALLEVQLEGKKRMTTDAFLRGYQVTEGSFLKERMITMPYYYYGFDPTYFLVIIGAVICMIASARVKSTYNKYSQYRSASGMTGAQAAQRILNSAGIYDVTIQHVSGNLTDHYNPSAKTLNLSDSVYNSTSVAAVGVAAHECGHAIQHQNSYFPLTLRTAIVPAANLGSTLAWPLILIGLFFTRNTGAVLINLGIICFSFAVIFQLVTLPVEFNASARALRILGEQGILSDSELPYTKKVLKAAALTYVASAAAAILQLLRLVLLFGGRDRD